MNDAIQDITYLFNYPHSGIVIALIFLLIALNPKTLYDMWRLRQTLDRGETLPDRLANFPVHPTSLEKYLNVKEKIDDFKNNSLRKNSGCLSLNSDEINDIYLQGLSINKYRIDFSDPFIKYNNNYLFFEVQENYIIQKRIKYIDIVGTGGIITETNRISFKTLDGSVLTKGEFVEWNGKIMTSDEDKDFYSISGNSFLVSLLRCDFTPTSYRQLDSNEHQLILTIIDKITSIEISNGCLNIKVVL
jgi:hypothetical protein